MIVLYLSKPSIRHSRKSVPDRPSTTSFLRCCISLCRRTLLLVRVIYLRSTFQSSFEFSSLVTQSWRTFLYYPAIRQVRQSTGNNYNYYYSLESTHYRITGVKQSLVSRYYSQRNGCWKIGIVSVAFAGSRSLQVGSPEARRAVGGTTEMHFPLAYHVTVIRIVSF